VPQGPDKRPFQAAIEQRLALGSGRAGTGGAGGIRGAGLAPSEPGEKETHRIATVLSMQPEILALDEPTAGLDPCVRRRLIRLLQALPQTMLAATHDLRFVAEVFGRAVILDGGQVVADGPTHQLLADEQLLEAHGLEA
ncbi:MAG TPA: energy-coupling factor ABC transporter ATP-binding protein, partial [Anaerolineae bacterium]|nr:energy-coupling factor ABC transporter ATP-binding protein [Anaerolineae bacterium]